MNLENKRRQLELSRVSLAKEEMLFKIEEMKEEIKRLEGFVVIQEEKIKSLNSEINNKEVK